MKDKNGNELAAGMVARWPGGAQRYVVEDDLRVWQHAFFAGEPATLELVEPNPIVAVYVHALEAGGIEAVLRLRDGTEDRALLRSEGKRAEFRRGVSVEMLADGGTRWDGLPGYTFEVTS